MAYSTVSCEVFSRVSINKYYRVELSGSVLRAVRSRILEALRALLFPLEWAPWSRRQRSFIKLFQFWNVVTGWSYHTEKLNQFLLHLGLKQLPAPAYCLNPRSTPTCPFCPAASVGRWRVPPRSSWAFRGLPSSRRSCRRMSGKPMESEGRESCGSQNFQHLESNGIQRFLVTFVFTFQLLFDMYFMSRRWLSSLEVVVFDLDTGKTMPEKTQVARLENDGQGCMYSISSTKKWPRYYHMVC